ncbi:hypothetical protein GCM10023085_76480 [Actinomadura viridis]|uniref:Uncharacterized protein n=1 Tax=Actinomadura viridis TaxID=58110 RepID=A0A931DHN1_9ACTN|nr:hypothetical protein [Actinomadura viridis]MBG6088944.1 hypothetical protein [Actinomadura viridis]
MSASSGVPSPEALEERITELRAAVRRAMARGDRPAARDLRSRLRDAEDAWDEAVLGEATGAAPAPAPARPAAAGAGRQAERGMVPVREQVHQALTLLGAPAAPKLIGSVYAAFFPGEIPGTRLTSLRRDEERSFRTAPYSRPYYLCAALTADLLAPARGLITVSTWPLEQRVVGPLSPRTDFLTAARRVAEHAVRGGTAHSPAVQRLLWRFAANIPGTTGAAVGDVDPALLAEAAEAELEVHRAADGRQRRQAAERARTRLGDAERLFGTRLRAMRAAASGTGGPAPAAAGPAIAAGPSAVPAHGPGPVPAHGPGPVAAGPVAAGPAPVAGLGPAPVPQGGRSGGAPARVPRGSTASRTPENPRPAEEDQPTPSAIRRRRAPSGGTSPRTPRRPDPPASSAIRPHRATHEDDR